MSQSRITRNELMSTVAYLREQLDEAFNSIDELNTKGDLMPTLTFEEALDLQTILNNLKEKGLRIALNAMLNTLKDKPSVHTDQFKKILDDAQKWEGWK